jgi:hypothetical protein
MPEVYTLSFPKVSSKSPKGRKGTRRAKSKSPTRFPTGERGLAALRKYAEQLNAEEAKKGQQGGRRKYLRSLTRRIRRDLPKNVEFVGFVSEAKAKKMMGA